MLGAIGGRSRGNGLLGALLAFSSSPITGPETGCRIRRGTGSSPRHRVKTRKEDPRLYEGCVGEALSGTDARWPGESHLRLNLSIFLLPAHGEEQANKSSLDNSCSTYQSTWFPMALKTIHHMIRTIMRRGKGKEIYGNTPQMLLVREMGKS